MPRWIWIGQAGNSHILMGFQLVRTVGTLPLRKIHFLMQLLYHQHCRLRLPMAFHFPCLCLCMNLCLFFLSLSLSLCIAISLDNDLSLSIYSDEFSCGI